MRVDVAVFIDFENVYVSVREKLDETPNFESIMDRCNDAGRVVIARAYADWYRFPRITSALYANGIEPIYVPTYYYDKEMGRTGRAIKNSVDMNLCIDAMKTLFLNNNISRFVLVTGDRDFIPLVNSIRQQGKEVLIIGIGGAASTHLAQSADEFIFYEQLVGKTPPAATRKVKPSRPTESISPITPPVPKPGIETPAPVEPDIYDTLVEAVHVVRERGYLSTLGSLKLVIKELMGGDFKESRYKDLNGRSFTKFKDFVMDAEKRGKVQIYTNGTVSEVFLPGEDARKLSQFADLKEETNGSDAREPVNGKQEQPTASGSSSSSSRSRRRRRPRNQRTDAGHVAPSESSEKPGLKEPEQHPPAQRTTAMDEGMEDVAEFEDTSELTGSLLDDAFDTATLDRARIIGALGLDTDTSLEQELPLFPMFGDAQEDTGRAFDEEAIPSFDSDTTFLFNVGEALTLAHTLDAHPLSEKTATDNVDRDEESPALTEPDSVPVAQESEQAQDEEITSPPSLDDVQQDTTSSEQEPAWEQTEPEDDDDAEMESEAEPISFLDEEWQAFRETMAKYTKSVSFGQIFDSLRGLRNQKVLTRTNEELRSFVKQAITIGMLERTARGKRVYYRLKQEKEAVSTG